MNNYECIAVGHLMFAAAGVPAWAAAGGVVAQRGFVAAAIADNGVGDWSVTLDGGGADATECIVLVNSVENLAVSSQTSYGVVHTSDTVKQITCVQEGGGGAASARYDGPCVITVFRRKAV